MPNKTDALTVFTLLLLLACVVLSALTLHKVSQTGEGYEYRGGESHLDSHARYKHLESM